MANYFSQITHKSVHQTINLIVQSTAQSNIRSLMQVAALLFLASCSDQSPTQDDFAPPLDLTRVSLQWQSTQQQQFDVLVSDARQLESSVIALLNAPGPALKTSAQERWQAAHRAWMAYRLFVTDDQLAQRLDAWPIQPGFIDSIDGYPDSGIVNDETLMLSRETLIEQHGITDYGEASLGLHPMEFMLFERDVAQFVAGNDVNDRRRKLLGLLSTILLEDIGETPVSALNEDSTPDQLLLQMLTLLQAETARLFIEATQFAEGHGFRSFSQTDSLIQSVTTLDTLAGTSSALHPVLQTIDADIAADFDKTMKMTQTLLANPIPDDSVRLPLLMAAMGHQFQDLERRLVQP